MKAQLRVPAGITRLRGGGRSKEDVGKGKTDKVIGSKVGKSPKKSMPKKSTPKKAVSKGKRKKESDGSSGVEEGVDSEGEDDDDDEVGEV